MSSPPTDVLAAAAERRAAALRQRSHLEEEYQLKRRQEFRRLIDPGIMRPNAYPVAMESLKVSLSTSVDSLVPIGSLESQVLLKIAENLLREPDNPKFQRFKPTNSLIKKHLIETKGALEYAIEVSNRYVFQFW
jgi:PUB domain